MRALLVALTDRIEQNGATSLSEQATGNSLYGLQRMTSESAEVSA